jgi:hypothetical protein
VRGALAVANERVASQEDEDRKGTTELMLRMQKGLAEVSDTARRLKVLEDAFDRDSRDKTAAMEMVMHSLSCAGNVREE